MKIAKNNLDVQIALLEAKLGMNPNIQWCADAVKAPKLQKVFKDMSESAMSEELQKLRVEKVKQKLFWIQKELNRAVKKAKAFSVQKIVKKMKTLEENKKLGMEEDLKAAKAVNHATLATQVYQKMILTSDNEYITATLKKLGLATSSATEKIDSKILQQKAVQADIQALQSDLESFLRKLLHEPAVKAVDETKPKREPKVKVDSESENDQVEDQVDDADSYFVSNLNKNSEDEMYGDSGVEKRKKNRMGQKARRALAESRFGQTANHLKAVPLKTDPRSSKRRDARPRHHDGPKYTELEAKLSLDELHPSWQAKQMAKQKEQNAHFQGTKKVFSDD